MSGRAPTTRAMQRDETRERILEAAIDAFSEVGFLAASTRDVARRAGVSQGLVTYHFSSKESLWRASADRIFAALESQLAAGVGDETNSPRERGREAIRVYVRFAASHPELFRFMVDEGRRDEERMHWLVETHVARLHAGLGAMLDAAGLAVGPAEVAHLYYVIAGAGSLMFAVAPECRKLTGIDPGSTEVIEDHADLIARLLLP
jgi:TetR/AcrR family transcriptional regulator